MPFTRPRRVGGIARGTRVSHRSKGRPGDTFHPTEELMIRSYLRVALLSLLASVALASSAFASDITGVVRDAQGNPEAGVQITCTDSSGKQVGQATTNDAGQYCIAGLVPGTYTCTTSPPAATGLQMGSATVTVPEQGVTNNWSLSPSTAAAISSSSSPGVCSAGLLGGYNPYVLGFLGIGSVAGISMGICASLGCISDSSPAPPVTGTK